MATGAVALQGLSEAEVTARRERGEGNTFALPTSRTYRQIFRDNAFTFVNIVLFTITALLLVMGLFGDALGTAALVVFNVVVGVVQEARAKQQLERIALLVRPKASVIREGQERLVDPSEIVLGDIIIARPGDQIVVDGEVVGDGRIDVDESLLTGESDPVTKVAGDPVYSGSFCVAGEAAYEARKVGPDSLINQLGAGARAFRLVKTPLQRVIDFILRIALVVAVVIGVQVASVLWRGEQRFLFRESVRAAAVIVALVPQGLASMVVVSYAMGAVRLAGKGILIQRANAIESLSHVNVLCLDKTGTLTSNRLRVHALLPLRLSEEELASCLGDYAATTSGANRTIDALRAAFPGRRRIVREEVPFSSARQWSALVFDDQERRGVYVFGAPEALRANLPADAALDPQIEHWAEQGLRVLLFAYRPDVVALDPLVDPSSGGPVGLVPAGLISLRDELRPDAQTTLAGFAAAGIRLKIISGDNPTTVAALARQAGFVQEIRTVSGHDLTAMDEGQLARVAQEATVFGRITPHQKERLVRVLRAGGNYVAMVGDGVNDVLALKQAQLAIAMQSGSPATRGIADIVLLDDSFRALPAAFREGQRIFTGMQDIIRLFLVRTLSVTLMIAGTALLGAAFPVTPRQTSLLALLTVGIPALALAAWAKPEPLSRGLVRAVSQFVFPAAVTLAAAGLLLYLPYVFLGEDVMRARTVLTVTAVLCGLLLILFVKPPSPAWVGGEVLSGDLRPALLAGALAVVLGVVLVVPKLREAVELVTLRPLDVVVILPVVAAWAVTVRWVWRARLFERFLGLDLDQR